MNKAVLLSIKPQYCELIASGKKTVEVRKTKPKLETPFKVYIYCTNTKPYLAWGDEFRGGSWETVFSSLRGYSKKDAERIFEIFNGKVIGEFVCDDIYKIDKDSIGYIYKSDKEQIYFDFAETILNMRCCLNAFELSGYLGHMQGNGWCISDLVIYDKPKELGEFRLYDCSVKIEDGYPMPTHEIKRPPQSWCYVEELRGENECR